MRIKSFKIIIIVIMFVWILIIPFSAADESAGKKDKKNPTITITYPEQGDKLSSSIIILTGEANDNDNLDKVEFRVGNGDWKTALGTESWRALAILSEGENTIYARAVDGAGNIQETSVTVTLDSTSPVISISSPVNDQVFFTPLITAIGTASDNDLDRVEVRVGTGAWERASGTTLWSAPVTLSGGLNTIYAHAIDMAGNIEETFVNVTLDNAPSISISSPINNQVFSTSSITVSGTASGTEISRVEVRVGTGTWQSASGTTSWSAQVTLSEGLNTIYARAIDTSENIQETSVTVFLDTAPDISISSPINNQAFSTPSITVSGTASGTEINRVEVRVGNGDWSEASGTASWSAPVTLSEGLNTIYAHAIDTSGNVRETSVTVTLETTRPTIIINYGAEYTNSSAVILNLSSTMSLMKFSNDNINWTDWEPYKNTKSWTLTPEDGTKTVFFAVSNDNTNEPTAGVSDNIILDTKGPTVSELKLSVSTPVVNDPVVITAKVSDNYLNTSNIFALVGSPSGNISECPMTGSGTYTCYFRETSGYGRYDVIIIASDLAGNIDNTEKTWFVTTTKPYENNSINTVENDVTEINALEQVNTILELATSNNINNGAIKITMSNDIPPEMNQSTVLAPFGKFISIESSNNLGNNLNWVKIKIYYTEDELIESGLDENSLKISHNNESSDSWESLSTSSPSWVNDAGVNTENIGNFSGFVWANISHFSTFGLVGSYPTPPSQPSPSSPSSGGAGSYSGSWSGGGSSGSSGGGGGGGSSDENYSNIELKEKYFLHIFKDKTTRYRFTNESNPVLFVNITGNVNAGEINTAVEVLKNTSSLVKNPPPGNVYRNLNIWVGTSGFAVKKNIKQGVILFKVKNSWLNQNNLASSDIKMVRWAGGKWVDIETLEEIKDGSFTYFEAETIEFSPIAITGIKEGLSEAFPEPTEVRTTETVDNGIESPGTAPPMNLTLLIGIFVLVGIIGILYIKRNSILYLIRNWK